MFAQQVDTTHIAVRLRVSRNSVTVGDAAGRPAAPNDMKALIAARNWLTVIQLPAYPPELNPVETLWAHVHNGLGNLAVCNVDELAVIVKTRLKRIQCRPQLIDAFFRHTGLTLETPLA
jgi:putative transposase